MSYYSKKGLVSIKLLFNKVSSFFYTRTKLWLAGLFFILIMLMLQFIPVFEKILDMSRHMISLDNSHLYSPEKIYAILTDWGENGRRQQIWLHSTWDLVFPVLYFFFLGFIISWLVKRGFKSGSNMQKINLLSCVAIVDILENICICILIIIYPQKVLMLGWIKTGLTFVKYYLFGPALLSGFLISIVFALKNRLVVQ